MMNVSLNWPNAIIGPNVVAPIPASLVGAISAALVGAADLRLRRVYVHVDRVVRHFDEEMHLGAALLDRCHAVGRDDGARNRPVLHHTPIDEDVLRPSRGSLLRKR